MTKLPEEDRGLGLCVFSKLSYPLNLRITAVDFTHKFFSNILSKTPLENTSGKKALNLHHSEKLNQKHNN